MEVPGTSKSDSRATIGSRKHVAIILRNFGVRIYCQHKVRNPVEMLALESQFGTEVPKYTHIAEGINKFDNEIPQDGRCFLEFLLP